MAGRPLRPATDHRLGRPLPHQQANRPQAPPQAPRRTFLTNPTDRQAHGELPRVSAGYPPPVGQVAHVFLTRPPRKPSEDDPVRLACIRHAASVDPEPGSNSPPKCFLHHPVRVMAICFFIRTQHSIRAVPFRRSLSPGPAVPFRARRSSPPHTYARRVPRSVFDARSSPRHPNTFVPRCRTTHVSFLMCISRAVDQLLGHSDKRNRPINWGGKSPLRSANLSAQATIVTDDLQGGVLTVSAAISTPVGEMFSSTRR